MAVGRAAGGIRVADTMRRPQEARTLRTCNRPDDPAEVCDLGLTCRGCKPCTDRSLGERGLIQMSALARLATQVGHLPRSEKCHVWTAPGWQGLSSRPQAGRCSHVFALFVRLT